MLSRQVFVPWLSYIPSPASRFRLLLASFLFSKEGKHREEIFISVTVSRIRYERDNREKEVDYKLGGDGKAGWRTVGCLACTAKFPEGPTCSPPFPRGGPCVKGFTCESSLGHFVMGLLL